MMLTRVLAATFAVLIASVALGAGAPGDDAKRYQVREVRQAIKESIK